MLRYFVAFFTIISCAISVAHAKPAAPEPVIIFGVVPQQTPAKIVRDWGPIIRYLSEKIHREIRFSTEKDIPSFAKVLATGKYDIVYCNPYHYITSHRASGYEAFAKERDRRLTGILVVNRDKPIRSLQDLANQTVVFPAPHAFAASMLPRAILKSRGIQITPKYVNNHESVYQSVGQGLFVAGGGIGASYNAFNDETKTKLKILWESDGYTPHAISAHPRLSRDVVEKIQSAFVAMQTDVRGKELLDNIGMKGVESARDTDWNDVRAIEQFLD